MSTVHYDPQDFLIVESASRVDIFGPTTLIRDELNNLGAECVIKGGHRMFKDAVYAYTLVNMLRAKCCGDPHAPTVVTTTLVNEPMRRGSIYITRRPTNYNQDPP